MNNSTPQQNSLDKILKGLSFQNQAKFIKIITIVREEHGIQDSLVSDSTVLRFFLSTQGNIDEAILGIRNNAEWQRSYPFDRVLSLDIKKFDLFKQCIKMGFYGTDQKGRPIRIIYISNFEPDILLDNYTEEELTHFFVQYLERIINIIFPLASERCNNHVNNILTIIDIKDLNVSKILFNKRLIDLFRSMSAAFQDNYPEMTYRAVILNANVLFLGLWKVLSVFVKQKTVDRICIVGEDYLPELTKYTTLDQLPVSLGGSCPHEIDQYPNFWDGELERSVHEKRFKLL
jgi:hypothetical protein